MGIPPLSNCPVPSSYLHAEYRINSPPKMLDLALIPSEDQQPVERHPKCLPAPNVLKKYAH